MYYMFNVEKNVKEFKVFYLVNVLSPKVLHWVNVECTIYNTYLPMYYMNS
jgi:hypothetical protein